MSDYDLITLYRENVLLLNEVLMDFVSMIFALLIAGYLIADKLKPSMVALVVILYTAFSGYLIAEIMFIGNDSSVYSIEMAMRVSNNEFSLPNLGMTDNPTTLSIIVLGVATIGSYFGALIFFFHQRHLGLKKFKID